MQSAIRAMSFFFTLALAGYLTACSGAAERNIVLFITDDLSPNLSCYGNETLPTPAIDALASQATLFTDAFATTASCSASRSVILTGLHNHANGQFGHLHNYHKFSTHSWVQSLPALLKRKGYRTVRIGKFHVGPDEVYPFDVHLECDDRDPVGMADLCQELFEEDSSKPFFLLFATSDPHRGGGFADELPTRPNRFGNPSPSPSEGSSHEATYQPSDVRVPPFLPDTPECRAELAQYYQSASRVDRGLGRLTSLLKDSGNWNRTLVLFTSDHGMAFAGAKTTVYEPGLRVPMIVRDPYQSRRPVRSQALVSLLDVTPTLLDFAGCMDDQEIIDAPGEKWEWLTFTDEGDAAATFETGRMRWLPYRFHGKSFLPILKQENAVGWDRVTASHTFHEIQMYYPMRAFRDRKYKLVWNIAHQLPFPSASDLWTSPTWQSRYSKGPQTSYGARTVASYLNRPRFELYDIENDPAESVNLAADESYAEVLDQYKEKLKSFQLRTGDPWALKWNYE